MIARHGCTVTFSPITYHFANESDAEGFLQCVKGVNGRPAICAKQWRCVVQSRQEKIPKRGLER